MTVMTLSANDRQRLMRSARKLEAILGTTPHVEIDGEAEPSSSTHRAKHRQARIVCDSPTASVSSLPVIDEKEKAAHSLPVRSASLSYQKSKVFMSLKATTFDSSPSQHGHGKALPRPLVLRLQAMGSRPASVIVPDTPTAQQQTSSSKRSQNRSSIAPLSPLTPTFTNNTTPVDNNYRRLKMAKLQRTFGENIPPEFVFNDVKKSRRRSCSVDSLFQAPPSFVEMDIEEKEVHSIPGVLEQAPLLGRKSPTLQSGRRSEDTCGRRKEREWSGEWNKADMEAVIAGLRGLRGR